MDTMQFGSKKFNEFIDNGTSTPINVDDKIIFNKHVLDFVYYALYANIPIKIKGNSQNIEAIKTLCFERKIATVNLSTTEIVYHVKSKEEKKLDNSCIFSFITTLNECKTRYEKIFAPVFEGKSNFDLLTSSFANNPRISLVPLADYLEVSENEYHYLIGKIEESLQFYDDKLDSYINLPLKQIFHKIKIEENSIHESVISKVQDHLDRINILKNEYIEALEEEIHLMKEANVLKVKEIKEELLDVKIAIDSFEDQYGVGNVEKPGILNFNKGDKDRYDAYQLLKGTIGSIQNDILAKFASEELRIDHTEISSVKLKILNALDVLPSIEDVLHNQSRTYIKRINHLNDTKFIFAKLYDNLVRLLDEMNESALYNEKFECNARSTLMQHEWIENLLKDVDIEVRQLKVLPKFFQWTNYMNIQDIKVKKLINALMVYPKDSWLQIFKDSYLYYYKNEKITLNSIVDQEVYSTLISDYYLVKNHIVTNAQVAREKLHKSLFEYYKNTDSKKLNKLKETGKIDSLGDEIHKLGVMFPCVYLDSNNQVEAHDIFINLGLDYKEIKISKTELNDSPVLLQQFSQQEIKEIPIADRIGSARLLTKSFLEVCTDFKIYHLSNASLIVVDNEVLPRAVEKSFDPKTIKHLQIGNNKEDMLLETILITDQPVYLICSNGILNQNFNNSLFWQIHLLEGFKSAGIKIINIWTTETKGRIENISKVLISHINNV
jgi:hypothetical protein